MLYPSIFALCLGFFALCVAGFYIFCATEKPTNNKNNAAVYPHRKAVYYVFCALVLCLGVLYELQMWQSAGGVIGTIIAATPLVFLLWLVAPQKPQTAVYFAASLAIQGLFIMAYGWALYHKNNYSALIGMSAFMSVGMCAAAMVMAYLLSLRQAAAVVFDIMPTVFAAILAGLYLFQAPPAITGSLVFASSYTDIGLQSLAGLALPLWLLFAGLGLQLVILRLEKLFNSLRAPSTRPDNATFATLVGMLVYVISMFFLLRTCGYSTAVFKAVVCAVVAVFLLQHITRIPARLAILGATVAIVWYFSGTAGLLICAVIIAHRTHTTKSKPDKPARYVANAGIIWLMLGLYSFGIAGQTAHDIFQNTPVVVVLYGLCSLIFAAICFKQKPVLRHLFYSTTAATLAASMVTGHYRLWWMQ